MAREGVHDAVEDLVRDGLLLVGATAQDQRLRRLLLELVEEAAHERGLAHPRARDDADHRRATRADLPARRVELCELLATTEERAPAYLDRPEELGCAGGPSTQACEDLCARGARRGLWREEVCTQVSEIGELRLEIGREARTSADRRQFAGERLVEHGSDAVPVRRWPHRLASRLLGRHVPRGSQRALRARFAIVHLGDEPEVEDDDAALDGHEDVRRLQVTMELARGVERVDGSGEVTGRRSQASDVDPRTRPPFAAEVVAVRLAAHGSACRLHVPVPDVSEERRPLDELHRDVPGVALRRELVQPHEVGVRQVGEGAELALEALERDDAFLAQHFQRNTTSIAGIIGFVDDTEAARSDMPYEHEAPQAFRQAKHAFGPSSSL